MTFTTIERVLKKKMTTAPLDVLLAVCQAVY